MTLEHRHYGKLVRVWRLLDPPLKQDQPQGQPGGENGEGGVPQPPEGMPGRRNEARAERRRADHRAAGGGGGDHRLRRADHPPAVGDTQQRQPVARAPGLALCAGRRTPGGSGAAPRPAPGRREYPRAGGPPGRGLGATDDAVQAGRRRRAAGADRGPQRAFQPQRTGAQAQGQAGLGEAVPSPAGHPGDEGRDRPGLAGPAGRLARRRPESAGRARRRGQPVPAGSAGVPRRQPQFQGRVRAAPAEIVGSRLSTPAAVRQRLARRCAAEREHCQRAGAGRHVRDRSGTGGKHRGRPRSGRFPEQGRFHQASDPVGFEDRKRQLCRRHPLLPGDQRGQPGRPPAGAGEYLAAGQGRQDTRDGPRHGQGGLPIPSTGGDDWKKDER